MEDMNIEVVPPYMIASKVNIYILSVVATHESNISSCFHFLMQTLKCHVILTAPLGGVTSNSANNLLCLATFLDANIEMSCDLDCATRQSNVNFSQ